MASLKTRLKKWLADTRDPFPLVPGTPPPTALLAGSFNPLHQGHVRLAQVAERRLGVPVHFELSITNVDKPRLAIDEILRRVGPFTAPLWLTAAPTFAEKARLFPSATFVVGHDTAERLLDPKYADGTPAGRDALLQALAALGTRVLVGGRVDAAGVFRTWSQCELCPELWLILTEADFRMDISSTLLRKMLDAI